MSSFFSTMQEYLCTCGRVGFPRSFISKQTRVPVQIHLGNATHNSVCICEGCICLCPGSQNVMVQAILFFNLPEYQDGVYIFQICSFETWNFSLIIWLTVNCKCLLSSSGDLFNNIVRSYRATVMAGRSTLKRSRTALGLLPLQTSPWAPICRRSIIVRMSKIFTH